MKGKLQLIGFLVFAAAAIYWNVNANIRATFQHAICRQLEQELAQWEAKETTLKDWSSRRDQAMNDATRDRNQLFRMYRVCRSVDDFVAIHPDQIQSVSQYGHEPQIWFYLPKGKHQLGIRFSEIGAEEARKHSDPGQPLFWDGAQEELLSLEGGRSYEARVTFQHENAPVTPFRSPVSSLRVSISEDKAVEFPFELSSIVSYANHYANHPGPTGLGLPNQIPDSFYRQRYKFPGKLSYPRADFDLRIQSFDLWRKSDNEKRVIRIQLFVRSDGPARVLPTNSRFCSFLFASGMSERILKHLRFEDANGWYVYPIPAKTDQSEPAANE